MATGTLYIYYGSKNQLINNIYLKTKREIVALLVDPSHRSETFYTTFRNMRNDFYQSTLEESQSPWHEAERDEEHHLRRRGRTCAGRVVSDHLA